MKIIIIIIITVISKIVIYCYLLLQNCILQASIVPDKTKAFCVPTYVLKYVMNGQWWPEGDAEYHCRINCPTLLMHGQNDRLIFARR